jgi:hypothetical protein
MVATDSNKFVGAFFRIVLLDRANKDFVLRICPEKPTTNPSISDRQTSLTRLFVVNQQNTVFFTRAVLEKVGARASMRTA